MASPTVSGTRPTQFIKQAAVQELLQCSRSTVHRYVKTGVLTAYRLGSRSLRFDPDEIEAMVRAAQVGGEH